MALSTPPTAPQRGDRATFAARVDAFITWLIGFVSELNIFSANLNSIAAGGAYAIPYVMSARDLAQNDGLIGTDDLTSQSSAIRFYINKITAGKDVSALLAEFDDSSSTVKGHLRIVKQSDPSKWLVFEIGSLQIYPRFVGVSGTTIFASSTNPFADGDPVMLYFQRTGDKGDTGAAYTPQAVKFSDRKASGTVGGTAVGNDATQVRTLNTTDYNTIPSGVSLSGNQFALPAGTYDFWGRVPFLSVGNFKANLYNVTDGTVQLFGSNGYSGTNGDQTDSVFEGRVTLAAPKTFSVRYYAATSGSTTALGSATSVANQLETYTEVIVTKVA